MRKGLAPIFIIVGVVLVVAVAGGVAFFVSRNIINKAKPSPTPVADSSSPSSAVTNVPSMTPLPLAKPGTASAVPADWQTYKSTQYGFEVSYPKTWKAVDDKTNLYGWPNGVVLIYKGGQSYDVPVEVWDSAEQYKAKYPKEPTAVFKVGSKFITIVNVNNLPEALQIIASFKIL